MAIISIPTSIGGVSIPGALVNGPLGALFGNKFSKNFLKYPRDLESATKGHVIQFTVQEVQPLSYDSVKSAFSSVEGAMNAISNVKNSVTSFIDNAKNGNITTNSLSFSKPQTKNGTVISLYIPETVNFQYNSSYTDVSMTDAVAKAGGVAVDAVKKVPLIGRAVDNITSAAESFKPLAQIGANAAGYALNPQMQLLFNGINFRTFQLAFTFTPYSKEEADTVKTIIETFRKNSAPKLVSESGGMFFQVPNMFNIRFLYNGSDNPNINKVETCVIESIDVNYSPNEIWSTHSDGAPVQTTLTMNFKEVVLIDRTKIEQGY